MWHLSALSKGNAFNETMTWPTQTFTRRFVRDIWTRCMRVTYDNILFTTHSREQLIRCFLSIAASTRNWIRNGNELLRIPIRCGVSYTASHHFLRALIYPLERQPDTSSQFQPSNRDNYTAALRLRKDPVFEAANIGGAITYSAST